MDETETDVDILLECLRYQNTDYQAIKRSLQALASVFNSDGNAKEYFRKVGGLHLVQRLLSADFPDQVLQAALFCLACAVENDVFCQSSVTNMETFEYLHKVLADKRRDRKWLQAATYLVVNLVAGNSTGQQLAKESGVLADLITVFRRHVDRKGSDDKGQDEVDLCQSAITALSMCVNNPQNEENQRLCCPILPLCFHLVVEDKWSHLTGSLLSFAGLTVSGNAFNQRRMKSSGGLDTLLQLIERCEREVQTNSSVFTLISAVISVIDACISDHEENAQYFVEQGGVEKVMAWLSGPQQLSPHHLMQLMLTLGHALEYADKTVVPLTNHHQTVLVQLLTDADDEELVRAIKYVLSSWQHLGEGNQESSDRQKELDSTMQRIDRLASQIHTVDQCGDRRMDQNEDRAKGGAGMAQLNLVVNSERHQSSQSLSAPYPNLPRPASVASTCVPSHEGLDAARQPVPLTADTYLLSHNGGYVTRQAGGAMTLTQTPGLFPSQLDSNGIRHQAFDRRSTHEVPQDSPSLAHYASVPVDTRRGGMSHGDYLRVTHDRQVETRVSYSQPPFSSLSAAPVSDVSVNPPQLTVPETRSRQVLHPQASFAAESLQHTDSAIPLYPRQPRVLENNDSVISQWAERPELNQPLISHQPMNMSNINGSTMSHPHQQSGISHAVPYHHNQQWAVTDPQQPVVTPTPLCPVTNGQLGHSVQVTQPGFSLAPRLPTFYFTKAPVSVSSCDQLPAAGVSGCAPQSSQCQAGTGQADLMPASYRPPTSLSQIYPFHVPLSCPSTVSGQPGLLEQRTSQSLLVPVMADQLPAMSSTAPTLPPQSLPPVIPQDRGLVTTPLLSAPSAVLSGEEQQQSLATGHLWRRVIVTAVNSNCTHSMPYAPAVQSVSSQCTHSMPYAPAVQSVSSQWAANSGTTTQSNCCSEATLRGSTTHSQHHHHPTVIHSQPVPVLSNQSALASSMMPLQTMHSNGPAASSTLAPPHAHYPNTTAGPMPPHTSVIQQQGCLASVHENQYSAAYCQSDRHVIGESETAVCSTLPHSCPKESTEQTAVGYPEGSGQQAGVQQSPPLITDTCDVTVVSGLEGTQTMGIGQNDSGYSESMNNSVQNLVPEYSKNRKVIPINKVKDKRSDITLSTGSFCFKPSNVHGLDDSALTSNQSEVNAVALKHNTQDGVFRVPFPKLGFRRCLQSGGKPSPYADGGVRKSPPLSAGSARKKGLRRAPSKTPDLHDAGLEVIVTTPTQNRTLGSRDIARHAPLSDSGDRERGETHPMVPAEQTIRSYRGRQHALVSELSYGLRPAVESSYVVPSSPAASEFDCQLLKTAALGCETSHIKLRNIQSKATARDHITTPVRMLQSVSSLQHLSQSNPEGSPAHSTSEPGSLEELGLRSGLDEKYEGIEFVADSEASDSGEECHILHNFSQEGLSLAESDSLSDVSRCLSEVYSIHLDSGLSYQAAMESGTDVCKVCPGCGFPKRLTSRTFNIAIETSSFTCPAHRNIRQLERDYIWKRACQGQLQSNLGHLQYKKLQVKGAKFTRKLGQGQPTTVKDRKGASCCDNRYGVAKEAKKTVHPSHVQQSAHYGGCRPLSMCEERRLRRAVARHGHNWTAVLQSGQFAAGRTAEELRDQWTMLCKNSKMKREKTVRS